MRKRNRIFVLGTCGALGLAAGAAGQEAPATADFAVHEVGYLDLRPHPDIAGWLGSLPPDVPLIWSGTRRATGDDARLSSGGATVGASQPPGGSRTGATAGSPETPGTGSSGGTSGGTGGGTQQRRTLTGPGGEDYTSSGGGVIGRGYA
ncbi:MAG: hypothetical protein L0216_11940 [Planctomycetales bacterium]|nr:hypothetical protein [Planctomycetales bacterium]